MVFPPTVSFTRGPYFPYMSAKIGEELPLKFNVMVLGFSTEYRSKFDKNNNQYEWYPSINLGSDIVKIEQFSLFLFSSSPSSIGSDPDPAI
jgi:hypothetical protein